jgi:serine/threonine protein kinase
MGTVYRARDEGLGREVAIKTLRRGHLATSDQLERFRREARLTAKLSHPGAPPIHALGTFSDGRPSIATRLIRGRTLQRELEEVDRVAELQRLLGCSSRLARRWATPTASASSTASSNRIIHRELKPLHVMVGAFGEVQVKDWGLAKELTDPQSRE